MSRGREVLSGVEWLLSHTDSKDPEKQLPRVGNLPGKKMCAWSEGVEWLQVGRLSRVGSGEVKRLGEDDSVWGTGSGRGDRRVDWAIIHTNTHCEESVFESLQFCVLLMQGPALYSFNDAKFSDADWTGIRMLSQSVKQPDRFKVGYFGMGFKSVFHITGMISRPQFQIPAKQFDASWLSQEQLPFLRPQCFLCDVSHF